MQKSVATVENSFMGPQKVKTWNFHIPSTAKYMSTRIENKYSKKKKNLPTKSQKLETTHISFNWWIEK